MLFSVFLGLGGYFQTRQEKAAINDDFPFRLFYGFTCGVLFLCTSLLGIQEFSGKNIDCFTHSGMNHRAILQYCWVSGTQNLIDSRESVKEFGDETCYRHGKYWRNSQGENCADAMTHSYYQWVPYVLLLQGCLFYFPRLYWLHLEEKKMDSFSDGVRAVAAQRAEVDEKVKTVSKNVADYINLPEAGHFRYGMGYLSAQILNAVMLCAVVYFNNIFLDGHFYDLGFRWLSAVLEPSHDSAQLLQETFPRLTSCQFVQYATSGRLTKSSYMCVLAPNIVSEKIFVFLWFWYLLLSIVIVVNILLVMSMIPGRLCFRRIYLMRAAWTRKVGSMVNENTALNRKLSSMSFGQFLFLYMLGRNVQYGVYKKILQELAGSRTAVKFVNDAIPLDSIPQVTETCIDEPDGLPLVNNKNIEDLGDDEIATAPTLPRKYPTVPQGQ